MGDADAAEAERLEALEQCGGEALTGGRGVRVKGWRVEAVHGAIANAAEREALEKDLGTAHLPEMLFVNSLTVTHERSGEALHFDARGALAAGLAAPAAPVRVAAAATWSAGHSQRFPDGMVRARPARLAGGAPSRAQPGRRRATRAQGGAAPAASAATDHDWTFTTPYGGDVRCAPGAARPWAPTEARVDRQTLMRRDPILFYDDVTLYESELDDNGVLHLGAKVRVMPTCWYVLLRFWLRVDGVLIRLRETRFYCPLKRGAPPVIVRETTWREETFEGLKERGAPASPLQYPDADQAASVLLAAGGPVTMTYEQLELGA